MQEIRRCFNIKRSIHLKCQNASLWRTGAVAAMLLLSIASCSLIDEDLSDCGTELDVEYDVKLETNLTTEIKTELETRLETQVALLVHDLLGGVFREYAHDVDLSFYIDNIRRHHIQHIMDAGQASYKLQLPADDYLHLALANIAEEDQVVCTGDDMASDCYLHQAVSADTVYSHSTGLFTARSQMDILGTEDQTFNVRLYMVNSAAILVVKTDNVNYRDIRTCYTGLGDGFYVKDSTFTFRPHQVVSATHVDDSPEGRECFYAVTFPSHDTHAEAKAAGVLSRSEGDADGEGIWEMHFYATMDDGHVVETRLSIGKPLKAGDVAIIYAVLHDDGALSTTNVEVGASVNFDWKPGSQFGPII